MSRSTMRPPYRLIAKISPIAVAGMLAFVPGAAAAPAPPMTVEVHPASGGVSSYFDLPARPGRRARAGRLELRNRLGRRVTVLLDRVDGLTASTLGSAYRVRGSTIRGPTRWTRLSDRRVVLGPHGRETVDVTVLPPRNAGPGDYLSGIGVQALGGGDEAKPTGNLAIASVERYAIGVVVRLPGPRHPLIRFTGARVEREPAGVTFYAYARNRGNVILQDVRGSETITQGDRVVARKPIGPGTFVTGTSIAYPLLVPRERAREGSVYRVRALLRYRGGVARLDTLVRFDRRSAERQAALDGPKAARSDSAFPFLLAAVGGIAVLSFAVILWLRLRSRKRSPLRTLEQALASAKASGEPLSLIRVAAEAAPAHSLEATLAPWLRRSDRICRLDGSGLLVVASDTPVQTAEHLAEELRRQLDRGDIGSDAVEIDVFAANGNTTATELLEQITRQNGGARSTAPAG